MSGMLSPGDRLVAIDGIEIGSAPPGESPQVSTAFIQYAKQFFGCILQCHIHVCVRVCLCVFVCVCVYACMCVCAYKCIHVNVYRYTYVRKY